MPTSTIQDKLAAAGSDMLRRMVGQTTLSATTRLKQLETQFGRDTLAAAIGDDAALAAVVASLEALSRACAVQQPQIPATPTAPATPL